MAAPPVPTVLAQSSGDRTTAGVLERSRPEFDALCVPTDLWFEGGTGQNFLVCPSIVVGAGYTDNVFRTEDDARGDLFTRISPQVTLQSDWANHALNLRASGQLVRHSEEARNDTEDVGLGADGRLDIREDLFASAELGWSRASESRDEPESPQGVSNVNTFYETSGEAAINYRPTDFVFRLRTSAVRLDFQDNGPIENDDRDRMRYEVSGRAGYEYRETWTAFVEPSYRFTRYDQAVDSAGFERDSQGFDVSVGVQYDVTDLTFLEARVGYYRETFADQRFDAVSGISAGIDMTWNPTDLMTVTASGERGVEQTNQLDASSLTRTELSLGLDYEILYDVLFTSGLHLRRDEFEGIDRTDDLIGGEIGLLYLMNEYATWRTSYQYTTLSSTEDGESFDANTVFLSLRLQY